MGTTATGTGGRPAAEPPPTPPEPEPAEPDPPEPATVEPDPPEPRPPEPRPPETMGTPPTGALVPAPPNCAVPPAPGSATVPPPVPPPPPPPLVEPPPDTVGGGGGAEIGSDRDGSNPPVGPSTAVASVGRTVAGPVDVAPDGTGSTVGAVGTAGRTGEPAGPPRGSSVVPGSAMAGTSTVRPASAPPPE